MLWKRPSVPGPTDLSKIRLALQAYNFGADSYFAYLKKTVTVWTAQSAQAFAQMASGGTQRDEDDPLHDPAC